MSITPDQAGTYHTRLLEAMEQILAVDAPDLTSAMYEAAQLIARTFGADEVDALIIEGATNTLVDLGTSNTPMGRRDVVSGCSS